MIDFGTAYFYNSNLIGKDLLEKLNRLKENEKMSDEMMDEEYHSKHRATFVGTAEFLF